MLLSASNSHPHVTLHREEISLHRKWMCLLDEPEFELLHHLSDEFVQLNL